MPRYFFDCVSDHELVADDHGIDLPDLNAAREHALRTARQVIAAGSKTDDWSRWTVDIADQTGEPLLVIPFSEALAPSSTG